MPFNFLSAGWVVTGGGMVSKRKVLQEGFCGVGCSPIAPALFWSSMLAIRAQTSFEVLAVSLALIVDGVLRLVLPGQWAGLVAGLQLSL